MRNMKRYIKSSKFGGYKYRYSVHSTSPEGKDIMLGGSKTEEGANEIAMEWADNYFNNPWETTERKIIWLQNIEIFDDDTNNDVMDDGTLYHIESLMDQLRK